MNQREKLAAEAEGFRIGQEALENELGAGSAMIAIKGEVYIHQRLVEIEREEWQEAKLRANRIVLEEGIRKGVAVTESRIRRIEWSKLFGVVVVGSVIGCGIVLALAVGLSFL